MSEKKKKRFVFWVCKCFPTCWVCIAPRGSSPHLVLNELVEKLPRAKANWTCWRRFPMSRELMWLDVKSGMKKRRKRWRNNRKGHSAIWCRSKEKREVPVSETKDSAILENCVNESKQKRREKYRELGKIMRDIQ